jgi:hypothetical protein
MHEVVKEVRGVVAERDGKYWGVVYSDGRSTSMGFGAVSQAQVADPKFCKSPEDLTWPQSPYRQELKAATLLPIVITTSYRVG